MRRLLVMLILLLWFGAATTVAVAWFYASMQHPVWGDNRLFDWSDESSRGRFRDWWICEWTGTGKRGRVLSLFREWKVEGEPEPTYEGALPWWSVGHQTPPPNADRRVVEDARGWPWLSLRCTWHGDAHVYSLPSELISTGIPIAPVSWEWLVDQGFFWGRSDPDYDAMEQHRALPFVPIWPGFIGSTMVWALGGLALALLIGAPGSVRRWLRRRLGRCIRCAYVVNRAQVDRCSECGWPLGRRAPVLRAVHVVTLTMLAVMMTGAAGAIVYLGRSQLETPGPMHAAARFNDVARLRELIAAGANVDEPARWSESWDPVRRSRETSPINWATAHGHTEALRVLIEAGADVDHRGAVFVGESVLVCAAAYGNLEAFRMIIDAGADVNADEQLRPLQAAAARGSVEMVRLLLDAGVNFNAEYTSMVYYAALIGGSFEIVEMLVESGARISTGGESVMLIGEAAGQGRIDLLELLVEAGATIRFDVMTPTKTSILEGAIRSRQIDAVRWLLDHGLNLDAEPEPSLWLDAEHGRAEIARLLLQYGADPNRLHSEFRGWTPLRQAILRGNLELARLLVEAGADPFTRTDEGETLIFDAVANLEDVDPLPMLRYLIDLGLDIDAKNIDFNTPLIKAVGWQREEEVRALLAAGADPRVADEYGRTPLQYAEQPLKLKEGGLIPTEQHDLPRSPVIQQLIREALERFEKRSSDLD